MDRLDHYLKEAKHFAKKTEKVPIILLPTDILLHHKNIGLYFDFYMNRMPLLHTKSYNITFLESEHCISTSADKIIKELHTVTNMYRERGFNIDVYHGINEFNINDFKERIRPASLNIYAKN